MYKEFSRTLMLVRSDHTHPYKVAVGRLDGQRVEAAVIKAVIYFSEVEGKRKKRTVRLYLDGNWKVSIPCRELLGINAGDYLVRNRDTNQGIVMERTKFERNFLMTEEQADMVWKPGLTQYWIDHNQYMEKVRSGEIKVRKYVYTSF